MINIHKLSPFKHFCVHIGNIPSAYEDSMSYYEMLEWFCKFLKDEVIPTVNTNAEAVSELQNYVEHYFDNLDIQEEINNKLDQMATDGTLVDIIAEYIQLRSILAYDTVSDMKNAENLVNGSFTETYGYYQKNDGGSARYKIREITNTDIVDEITLIALSNTTLVAELVIENEAYLKQFGAIGNGEHDDTINLQTAINYCYEKNTKLKINGTNNFYKTTMPIVLDISRGDKGFWMGTGSIIEGENKDTCRIVKIGTSVYTNHPNSNVNNINAVFISVNTNVDLEKGTGITIDNVSLENYTNANFQISNGSLGILTNVSRSTYKNLNIIAYKGIDATVYSSLFENIVFSCNENALKLTNGTSNTFRFLYAPNCLNPYEIRSSYSTLLNVCCDNGKGTIFTLAGMGLSLINCGSESKHAQYIFSIASDFTNLKIDNFYMIRQIGDADSGLSLNDCSILYSNTKAVVDINNLSVAEFDAINTSTANSSVFKVSGNASTLLTTSLTNLRYYKNFSGTSNARMKLWGSRPGAQCAQRYSSQTVQFNYIVTANLEIYPFIGGYFGTDLTDDVLGNSINTANISDSKTIWLDCKDKYHIANGTEIRYLSQRSKGDVQIYNDPKLMNAFGLSITNIVNGYTWDTIEIPLVLRGATSERPTQNLFIGLQYFDTTLNKPIWWNGSRWVDATGTQA